jgi:hypothetical protein
MGSHPVNLLIRFLLELIALLSVGLWGWKSFEGVFQYILGLGLPILMTIVWGTFAVPNDPSRSGKAPIPVSGLIRLIIEFIFFALAVWTLYQLDYTRLSYALCAIVLLHYLVSYDRIKWLLSQKNSGNK